MDFKDKVAVVTGASVGMGKEIAVQFAAKGAKVVVNYVAAEADAQDTVNRIRDAGGEAISCRADIARDADAVRLIAAAVKEYGRLDILVNNAGVSKHIPFADLDAADDDLWHRIHDINVLGTFHCVRAAAKEMQKSGGGSIVNLTSVSGFRPVGSSLPYCASKAALIQLTSCLAVALGPGIRVNSVSPGAIEDTRWNAGRKDFDAAKAHAQNVEKSVLRRGGRSLDIAHAVLYLCSEEASFITGVDIPVDGGRALKM